MARLYERLSIADLVLSLLLWPYEQNPLCVALGPVRFVLGKVLSIALVLLVARLLRRVSRRIAWLYLALLTALAAAVALRNVAFALTLLPLP